MTTKTMTMKTSIQAFVLGRKTNDYKDYDDENINSGAIFRPKTRPLRDMELNTRPREMIEKKGGNLNGINGMKASAGVNIGLSPFPASAGVNIGISPFPIPGANGGFQFQIGPIGYGSNWTFGLPPPGSIGLYAQPLPWYYYPYLVRGYAGRYELYPARQYYPGANQMGHK